MIQGARNSHKGRTELGGSGQLLLGLAQTCRFQDKSLLKFLLSGEKDVDAFKPTKRRRRVTAPGPHQEERRWPPASHPGVTTTSEAGLVPVGEEFQSMSRRRKYREKLLERGADVLSGAERQRLVELERENGELRRANEILRAASV